jgi:hypothetical protein
MNHGEITIRITIRITSIVREMLGPKRAFSETANLRVMDANSGPEGARGRDGWEGWDE